MPNSTVRILYANVFCQRIVTFVEKCIRNQDCQQIFREVMSGDYPTSDIISGTYNYNGTDNEPPEEAAGTHIDDPNGSLYMLCGVLIAMLLVGVIIVLLAVTIRTGK